MASERGARMEEGKDNTHSLTVHDGWMGGGGEKRREEKRKVRKCLEKGDGRM